MSTLKSHRSIASTRGDTLVVGAGTLLRQEKSSADTSVLTVDDSTQSRPSFMSYFETAEKPTSTLKYPTNRSSTSHHARKPSLVEKEMGENDSLETDFMDYFGENKSLGSSIQVRVMFRNYIHCVTFCLPGGEGHTYT